MPIRVETYVAGGIVSGIVARSGRFRDVLEAGETVEIERATWTPLDGPAAGAPRGIAVEPDDLLIAAADDDAGPPVHAVWHSVRLVVGPYVVEGELPTLPGFDPGRALTRPTGSFVLLRDVRVTLTERPDAGCATHDHALVNRYAVDEVSADLMLGFFFPGAHYPPGADPATGVVATAG
jgi:hypothetical protein